MIRLVFRAGIALALVIFSLRAFEPRGGIITDTFNSTTSSVRDYCTTSFDICKPVATISTHVWQSANVGYDIVAGNGELIYVPHGQRHPSTQPAPREPQSTDLIATTLESLGFGAVNSSYEPSQASSCNDSVYPLR